MRIEGEMSAIRDTVSAVTPPRFRPMASTDRRRVVLFVALLSATRAGTARAAKPISARLEWNKEDAPSCIDGTALASAVDARWGRPVFVSGARADVVVSGHMGRSRGGFVVTIELRREGGESLGSRTLKTAESSCRALDDSVALAVGLMLDVSRQRVAEERRATAGPLDADTAVFDGPTIAIPRSAEAHAKPWRVAPWVGAEMNAGLLPSAAFAARGGLAFVPPSLFRIELGVSFFVADDATVSSGRGVTASALTVDAGLCLREWERPIFSFATCAVERVGRVRGEGFGFSNDAVESGLLFDVGLRQVGLLRIADAVALRVGAQLEVPLVRYRFVFDDAEQRRLAAYEMSKISAGLDLGIGVEW
jgi:hypothetical protein